MQKMFKLFFKQSECVLNNHIDMCQSNEACKIDFPEDDYLYFKSYHTKIVIPIRVYADFECFNIPNTKQLKITIQKFIYLFTLFNSFII